LSFVHALIFESLTLRSIPPTFRECRQQGLFWLHCVSVYLFTLVTLRFLWTASGEFLDLRWAFLMRPTAAARSVIVNDVDARCQSNRALWDAFARYDAALVVLTSAWRDVAEAP
jgi:hypothetical protein